MALSNFQDFFDNSSLDANWGTSISTTGVVEETVSLLVSALVQDNGGALVYYTTPVNPRADNPYQVRFKFKAQNLSSNSIVQFGLYQHSSTPVCASASNLGARFLCSIRQRSDGKFYILYWNTSGTGYYWTGSAWSTTSTSCYSGTLGSEYYIELINDGTNLDMNIYMSNGTTQIASSTIAWSSVRAEANNTYFFFGEPTTDYHRGDMVVTEFTLQQAALQVNAFDATSISESSTALSPFMVIDVNESTSLADTVGSTVDGYPNSLSVNDSISINEYISTLINGYPLLVDVYDTTTPTESSTVTVGEEDATIPDPGEATGRSVIQLRTSGTCIAGAMITGRSVINLSTSGSVMAGAVGIGRSTIKLSTSGICKAGTLCTGRTVIQLRTNGTAMASARCSGRSTIQLSTLGSALAGAVASGQSTIQLSTSGSVLGGAVCSGRSVMQLKTSGTCYLVFVATDHSCIVVNTQTGAVTEYTNYAFNSFCRDFNGKVLGMTSTGIYELDGADDNGTAIDAVIKWGFLDPNVPKLSTLDMGYVTGKMDTDGGELLATVICDEDTSNVSEYTMSHLSARRDHPFKIAKGFKGRLYEVQLENIDGAGFEINNVRITAQEKSRIR